MQLNVFVTDQGDGTGPIVFVPNHPASVLPKNPRALQWRYFATVMDDDHLLTADRELALADIKRRGYYIADRMT